MRKEWKIETRSVAPEKFRYALFFHSFFSIHSLQERGVDSVMRLHQRRRVDFRRVKRLAKDDIFLNWTKPEQRPETRSQRQRENVRLES